MRVLVCIPCLLHGGTEVQTLSLVEALVAAGHEVTVACYFEHHPVMVARYEQAGADVRLLSPEGTRPAGLLSVAARLARGLYAVVHSSRPDVAHVQYMTPGALPIFMLRAMGVRKILATTHTAADIYSPRGLKLLRWLSNHLLTGLQCITLRAETSYFGNASLFDGTLRPHFTIYNTIPSHISLAQQSRQLLANDAEVTVGVVSRLAHIKGMDLVVPAFARAHQANGRLRLLVVGEGPEWDLMHQQVAESGLERCVTFVGVQQQSALSAYYDRIDILLMPSRSEGFGLTAIEGMARGCVPVVAHVGGLPEVVTPEAGWLHRPEDVADMAAKIQTLAADTALLAQYSAGAWRRAQAFAPQQYQAAIAQLYAALSQ
jgi:glycosyltransferase involved in cell wall biosynthesis